MAHRTAPSSFAIGVGWFIRYAQRVLTFLILLSPISTSAGAADDGYYDVKIKAIEAFLVDRATGKLSENVVGASPSVFISAGNVNDTKTKSADDVLVTVHFERTYNQAFQPRVTLFALAHLKNGVPPYDDFISVVQWQNENDLGFGGEQGNKAAATMLLNDVTCYNLDIVAVVDGGSTVIGDRAAVMLPFVCEE